MTAINETLYTEYEAQEQIGRGWQHVGTFTSFERARGWFDGCVFLGVWRDRGFRVIARNGSASKVALVRNAGNVA